MGKSSRSGAPAGVIDGKLAICPGTSNCVCSEYNQGPNYIEPMGYLELAGRDISDIALIVQSMGGTLQEQTEDYLSSTFESSLFGFTDDLEVRIDRQQEMMHFRSSSRVGRNDLGVNRQRVEKLKLLLSDM
ncbi:hypothetical protein BOW16_00440 [Solemya velum gill symbiont]|nr:hypothetical protein BOV97_00610 [Solemya velum gill symbiont]OOY57814.1 hypothetical protein BOV99_00665 [Solemya velum gill symbiont]OOY58838.1 hypothetical protein BOW00_00665 [Solemya velum gill symbiont]OOY61476.1 hypothetical protein BOW02_02145 [Solemya velum gill symbiont]OOY63005.1 hypothetical protein BOW04_03750 [Solemya velum gill symbiont]